jgi:hypothetical protein
VITKSGGSSSQLGAAIAALNVGALFAPIWGWAADRSLAYRAIFFGGFLLIAAGFLGFTFMRGFAAWLVSAFLVGFGIGASNTVARDSRPLRSANDEHLRRLESPGLVSASERQVCRSAFPAAGRGHQKTRALVLRQLVKTKRQTAKNRSWTRSSSDLGTFHRNR